jgi:hypothetical protein
MKKRSHFKMIFAYESPVALKVLSCVSLKSLESLMQLGVGHVTPCLMKNLGEDVLSFHLGIVKMLFPQP